MKLTRRRIIIFGVSAIILAGVPSWLFLFNRLVRVPTGAMANTILPGESLVVDRFFDEIKRGDIIIFKYPADHSIMLGGAKAMKSFLPYEREDPPVPKPPSPWAETAWLKSTGLAQEYTGSRALLKNAQKTISFSPTKRHSAS